MPRNTVKTKRPCTLSKTERNTIRELAGDLYQAALLKVQLEQRVNDLVAEKKAIERHLEINTRLLIHAREVASNCADSVVVAILNGGAK